MNEGGDNEVTPLAQEQTVPHQVTIDGPGSTVARSASQQMIAQIRSESFMQQIAMALPEGVTPERFVRATVTALMQNHDLAEKSSADSIFQSIIRCAQDGLLPDGHEAALVIFKGKAQYLPMIGGYRKIAAEHGWTIRTAVIYANDDFHYTLGLDPTLNHNPVRLGSDRGERIGAYAVGVHRDGRKEIEVMSAADVEKVRNVSRAKDNGPWRDWTDRMWEKTPGRRLFAKLAFDPGDRRIARIIATPDFEPEQAFQVMYGQNVSPGEHPTVDVSEFTVLEDDAGAPVEDPESSQQAPVEAVAPPADTGAPGDEDAPGASSAGDAPAADSASGEQAPEAEPAPSALPAADDPVGQEREPGDAAGEKGRGPVSAAAGDPAPPSEPVIPGVATSVADELSEAEVDALPAALALKIPSGSYQARSLGWVLELGEPADEWLSYALRQPWPHDAEFKVALTLAVKAHRPAMFSTWKGESA